MGWIYESWDRDIRCNKVERFGRMKWANYIELCFVFSLYLCQGVRNPGFDCAFSEQISSETDPLFPVSENPRYTLSIFNSLQGKSLEVPLEMGWCCRCRRRLMLDVDVAL